MPMPAGIPVVDTMIGFPHEGFSQYDFIRRQTKDKGSLEEIMTVAGAVPAPLTLRTAVSPET